MRWTEGAKNIKDKVEKRTKDLFQVCIEVLIQIVLVLERST